MSGLVGFWNFDDEPADRSTAASLASAIAHRGGDHSGSWLEGSVALGCELRRVVPEAGSECQPLADDAGHVLVFDGRLDNREELQSAVSGVPVPAPDGMCVLAAWREWGDGCLKRLAGEFALACFDARRRQLFLARDPVGCRPLYYCISERRLVFGSEIKAVLAHPEVVAAPDADLLADALLLDRMPHADEGGTFFDGIRAVLPGCCVRVTPGRATSARFWDFDPAARVRYRTAADYAEHLQSLLRQAVTRRLRSARPVAIAVSGGLDSSIVLAMAEDVRRRDGRTPAPALAPIMCRVSDEETAEANAFVRLLEDERALHVERLPLGMPGGLGQLQHAARHSESPFADDGWRALQPLLSQASGSSHVLMTGLWSDQIFFTTSYLVDLFFAPAWRQLWRHLRAYPRWFVDADAHYFRGRVRRELVAALIPPFARARLRTLLMARTRSRHSSLVSEAFVARLRRGRPRTREARFATHHARGLYHVIRAQAHRLQIEADEKLLAANGLEHTTPFLDRDVLAFVMSIPGELVTREGVPRALLREAGRGVVPEAILARRWRNEGAGRAAASRRASLAAETTLSACARLGFVREPRRIDDEALPLLGLELWSREFFSGRLGARTQRGSPDGGTGAVERRRREAAVLAAHAHGLR